MYISEINLSIILDPSGVVQRDLHNMDPEYLQYKFSYSNEMSSKLLYKSNHALFVFVE
jgi:hypothetical protein